MSQDFAHLLPRPRRLPRASRGPTRPHRNGTPRPRPISRRAPRVTEPAAKIRQVQ